jgi:hypothetical protein
MKKSDWAFLLVVAAITAAVSAGILSWVQHANSTGGSGYDQPVAGGSGQRGSSSAQLTGSSPRLLIPSIGTSAPVVPEGATGPDGGALTIPSSVQVVGWWDGAWQSPNGMVREKVASPGQPGVALLAGHIDSATQGPGALYRLQQIKVGAAITVVSQGGATTHWKVTGLQIVAKDALPSALFVNSGPPRLAVVSCGGPFDSATGHYADNVIAWADPAG